MNAADTVEFNPARHLVMAGIECALAEVQEARPEHQAHHLNRVVKPKTGLAPQVQAPEDLVEVVKSVEKWETIPTAKKDMTVYSGHAKGTFFTSLATLSDAKKAGIKEVNDKGSMMFHQKINGIPTKKVSFMVSASDGLLWWQTGETFHHHGDNTPWVKFGGFR